MYIFIFIQIVYVTLILYAHCKDCKLAKSCIGMQINDTNIVSNAITGYKAAYGATTQYIGSHTLSCDSAYACSSMRFIKLQAFSNKEGIWCEGSNSCSNTTVRIGYNESRLYCYGMNACTSSDIYSINDTAVIHCDGYRSCANTNIYRVKKVYAYATLALYRAVIDTNGAISNEVTIDLRAHYAAYGARLICDLSHICYIYCKSNSACHNFYIECTGNCVIDPSQNTIIPNNNLPLNKLADFNDISYNLSILADFAGAIVEINTDSLCPNNGIFDRDKNPLNITLEIDDEGPICCRAAGSCWYEAGAITRIKYETQKKTDLICSGKQACKKTHISNVNDTIFCEGRSSCIYSIIDYVDYVYCSGDDACKEANITGSKYIKCDAGYSCESAIFISGSNDLFLYLNAYKSGRNTIIYCDKTDVCTINCMGYKSCVNTQIICDAAANCIINCDINIVKACPVILTYSPTTAPILHSTNYSFYSTESQSFDASLYYHTSFYSTYNLLIFSSSNTLHPSIEPHSTTLKVVLFVLVLSVVIIAMIVIIVRKRECIKAFVEKHNNKDLVVMNSIINTQNTEDDDRKTNLNESADDKYSNDDLEMRAIEISVVPHDDIDDEQLSFSHRSSYNGDLNSLNDVIIKQEEENYNDAINNPAAKSCLKEWIITTYKTEQNEGIEDENGNCDVEDLPEPLILSPQNTNKLHEGTQIDEATTTTTKGNMKIKKTEYDNASDSDNIYCDCEAPKVDSESRKTKETVMVELETTTKNYYDEYHEQLQNETHLNQLDTKQTEGENDAEYEWIKATLQKCDANEWMKYLEYFKREKVNDSRVYLIEEKNEEIWKVLLPEAGVRLQFIYLWKQKYHK